MNMQKERPHVSFVVPVHNAGSTIGQLMDCINAVKEFDTEIVLVDDASTDNSPELIRRASSRQDNIIPVFNEENLGAGHSRNIGFEISSGKYTIFLDADDVFHADQIHDPVCIMDREDDIDVAVFQYCYTDGIGEGYEGMSYIDEQIFRKVLSGSSEKITDITESAELTRLTNYPWNKLLRSSRYNGNKRLFGLTKVHNDILAHWHVLLHSRKVLVNQGRICTHIVPDKGKNITNIHSEKRLEMFEALRQTYGLLSEKPYLKRLCVMHFWDLTVSLASWAESRTSREMKPGFYNEYRKLIGMMDFEDIIIMRKLGYHTTMDQILRNFACN